MVTTDHSMTYLLADSIILAWERSESVAHEAQLIYWLRIFWVLEKQIILPIMNFKFLKRKRIKFKPVFIHKTGNCLQLFRSLLYNRLLEPYSLFFYSPLILCATISCPRPPSARLRRLDNWLV